MVRSGVAELARQRRESAANQKKAEARAQIEAAKKAQRAATGREERESQGTEPSDTGLSHSTGSAQEGRRRKAAATRDSAGAELADDIPLMRKKSRRDAPAPTVQAMSRLIHRAVLRRRFRVTRS